MVDSRFLFLILCMVWLNWFLESAVEIIMALAKKKKKYISSRTEVFSLIFSFLGMLSFFTIFFMDYYYGYKIGEIIVLVFFIPFIFISTLSFIPVIIFTLKNPENSIWGKMEEIQMMFMKNSMLTAILLFKDASSFIIKNTSDIVSIIWFIFTFTMYIFIIMMMFIETIYAVIKLYKRRKRKLPENLTNKGSDKEVVLNDYFSKINNTNFILEVKLFIIFVYVSVISFFNGMIIFIKNIGLVIINGAKNIAGILKLNDMRYRAFISMRISLITSFLFLYWLMLKSDVNSNLLSMYEFISSVLLIPIIFDSLLSIGKKKDVLVLE